jgi:hypothetical protein
MTCADTKSKETFLVLPKDNSMVSTLAALVLSAMLGNTAYSAYLAMQEKADAQAKSVAEIQDWKRQYKSLLPVEERWQKTLGSMADAKDLFTIYGLVSQSAPSTNPDTFLVDRIERVTQSSKDLGAQRVCVSSGGGSLTFNEKDFTTLMARLKTLSSRSDMQVGGVVLSQEKGQAKAVVTPVCLLLRDPESAPNDQK